MKKVTNFLPSVYLLIMVDTLLLRPSLHITTLHFFPFKFHPTTLHNTVVFFLNSSVRGKYIKIFLC